MTQFVNNLQCAERAAAAGKPWTGDALAALVRGSLGTLQLAHAEAAAQRALPSTAVGAGYPDPRQPFKTRRVAGDMLLHVSDIMTPHVSRTFAQRGLVPPLLEVISLVSMR